MNALLNMVRAHKAGEAVGIYSLCSAHPLVLEAGVRLAAERGDTLLVEATANQVNQFGGYTGMTPATFRAFVEDIAIRHSLPISRLVLGGDHLGPTVWRGEPAQAAMQRAADMITAYVAAGFRKLHLDCSMSCLGEPVALSDELIAARAAQLCKAAEAAWRDAGGEPPLYVIGTEVPTPGGAAEALEDLAVSTPAAVDATLEAHRSAFAALGLQEAWQRVLALVVQPGVEFDHRKVIDYVPSKARDLARRAEREATLVYEAHSTDYQTPAALQALVKDHFAILKVGPGATFALRETLWALSDIAAEMGLMRERPFKAVVLEAMRRDSKYWKAYYVDAEHLNFDLQYSLSDRIRYYWTQPDVMQACAQLLQELGAKGLPLSLLSQYLPLQYQAIRAGALRNDAHEVAVAGVAATLRHYASACNPRAANN
jgi:D-tagatose-1,6-bisphosphate aldolase subunit GatZ/KbaZ